MPQRESEIDSKSVFSSQSRMYGMMSSTMRTEKRKPFDKRMRQIKLKVKVDFKNSTF